MESPASPRGPQGLPGADSIVPGPAGPAGPAGLQGEQGVIGPQGPIGARGCQGETGPQGLAGAAGADGTDGADGKSAYEIAVEQGYVGTEDEWLASLKGDTGATGAEGPQGLQGETGPIGPQGPQGPQGSFDPTQDLFYVSGPTGSASVKLGETLSFESDTLDISVTQGSAIVKLETPVGMFAQKVTPTSVEPFPVTVDGTLIPLNVRYNNAFTANADGSQFTILKSGLYCFRYQINIQTPLIAVSSGISYGIGAQYASSVVSPLTPMTPLVQSFCEYLLAGMSFGLSLFGTNLNVEFIKGGCVSLSVIRID